MTVEEQIREIVAKITRVDKSIITRQSTFKEIKADSLDVVQALVQWKRPLELKSLTRKPRSFRTSATLSPM